MSDPAVVPHRFRIMSGRARFIWIATWLGLLIIPLSNLDVKRHPTPWLVAYCGCLVLFAVLYLRTMWDALRDDDWNEPSGLSVWLVVFIAGTLIGEVLFGAGWLGLSVYLGVATAVSMQSLRAAAVVTGVMVATAAIGIAQNAGIINVVVVCFLTGGLAVASEGARRLFGLVVELRTAHARIEELTAERERLRFSRDLHDVLGHNLSAISLQAQVAKRTVLTDPTRAADAVRDIELVAHQSLDDVRSLVAGYRPRTLKDELKSARRLLAAAGISPSITEAVELPREIASVASWTIREAVTNVLRHSRATHCSIELRSSDEGVTIEIRDDGIGSTEADGSGNGLRNVRERVAALGGIMSLAAPDGGGFWLSIQIPVPAS